MKQKRQWILALCMMLTSWAWAQQGTITVKGQVVDQQNEPLMGVTVQAVGQSGGAVTDLDGYYTIKVASDGRLKFTYVGYQEQTVAVGGRPTVNVTMSEDAELLQEVVVVGYGTQKKESLTGAVTVVDSKAFEEKGGLSSPLQALQGQVAGVIITRGSSAPGDESWSMNLRGASSMNTTEPLIIIDGVAANSVSDMRNLNPNDIESINFLKDGSAAIYGSRAAGGVVLITTKKGKEGRVKVEYGASATLKTVGLQPTMMTIDEWADGVMTALRNDGNESNVWYTYAELAKLYKGRYINLQESANPFGTAAFTDVQDFVFSEADWLGELFGSTWSTEHQLSVSGGTDRSSYRLSLGYNYDGSTLQYGDNNNQRYNFRLNNTFKFSDRVALESSIAYSRQEQVAPTMISSALTNTMPMPGLPFTAMDGKPYAWGTWGSPVAKVQLGGNNKLTVSNISISETLKYDITDWLTANANVGYNTGSAWRNTVQNSIQYYNYMGNSQTLKDPAQANSMYTQTSARTDFYSFSGYLNAHKTLTERHNLSLTLGAQYEFKQYTYFGANVKDIQEGLEIVNGAGEITLTGKEDLYENAIMSYFGRFNYDYAGKYLFEFNGRYDGSSKFLPENRWDFFWGTSVGWRISEEQFMKSLGWIANLKLRASYAEMGNQSGISNYDGVQLYNLNSATGAYIGADKLSYIATSGVLASKSRSWERIKNYNIALDFGFFNNALTGTVEYFEKHNDNMLVGITFPATLGDKAPSANAGKFKDWGWEGQIMYRGRVGKVDYHVGGTLTFARNELTDYGATTVLTSGYRSNTQGYPLKSIFGLRYAGRIENAEQLSAYKAKYYENNGIGMPSNLRVGDNLYCDENGDGKLDEKDYIYLGSDDPEISYSFNAGVAYQGFDLNVVFQGAANRFVYRDINNFTVPMRANYTNTTNASVGNTWSADNPGAWYNPYTNDGNINNYNYQANSLTAQDGRYLRLKNVTIGYTFPQSLLKKTVVLHGLRLYVTGTDLWETTKIKDGWDPEARRDASGVGRYPFTRNFTFGANFTF